MNVEDLELELTEEQQKAAQSVYRAIRKAGKLGVCFWDNYGTLTAYNSKRMTLPIPLVRRIPENAISMNEYDPTYYEELDNYFSDNADDELHYETIVK